MFREFLDYFGRSAFRPYGAWSARASVGATLGAPEWRSSLRGAWAEPWVEKDKKHAASKTRRRRRKVRLENRCLHGAHTSFPFNVLNYAFGMTEDTFSRFVVASFVFMLPGVAFVLFSSSLKDALGASFRGVSGQASLLSLFSLIPLVYKGYPLFQRGRGTHPKWMGRGIKKKNGQ